MSPVHLEIVQRILRKHVPDLQVFAFGSRAQNTARPHSDLDLAIMTRAPLSFALLGALQEDFSESDLPFQVDILDWALTGEKFRRVVEQDRILVQPARCT